MIFSGMLLLLIPTGTHAQDSTKQQKQVARQVQLTAKIEGRQFTFVAQNATPQSGRLIQLTSLYTLKVINDSVVADLPYFGQTYMGGGYGSGSAGIQFATSDVSFQSTPAKNGWNITISPKGNAKVQKCSSASVATDTEHFACPVPPDR